MKFQPAVMLLLLVAQSSLAIAELKPDRVHVADGKKNGNYIKDGLITGGDQAISEVVVRDIRRAVNPGFERIVIDLEGLRSGEPAAIPRPPYYQISVTPDEKRLVFNIWGRPKVAFNSSKVTSAFKRSAVVQGLQLLPPIDPEVWTFVAELRAEHPVEVFELSNPVRIIIDIKTR